MDQNSTHAQALTDARDWFARLKGTECTAAERMEFQRWKTVPQNAEAYAMTEGLWQSFDGLKNHPEVVDLIRQVMARTTPARAVRPQQRWYALAASVLACALGLGAYFVLSSPSVERYVTARGERSTVTLADGSKIFLNSATELEVRFDRESRRFALRKGEALFVVAPESSRPFTVTAGDGRVTALGTRFQVRNDPSRVIVTLLEGAVALDRGDVAPPVRLAPGEQIRFAPAKPEMTRRTVDPEVAASWSTGWLRFRATPLIDVLEEVNRYSSVQIRIGDPTVDPATPISGTFEVGDSASVISALEALLPVEVVKRDSGEIVLQSR